MYKKNIKNFLKNIKSNNMKKKWIIRASLLIIMILFIVGCKEGVVTLPQTSKHTIEIVLNGNGGTVSPLGVKEVIEGSSLDIALNNEPGYKSIVLVNGNAVTSGGNIYTLSNIYSNQKVEVSFEKTQLWYLIQKPWNIYLWQRRLVTSSDWELTLSSPNVGSSTLVFDEKGRVKGNLIGDVPYELKGDSLIIGGGLKNKIIVLNGDNLVIRHESDFYTNTGHDHTQDVMVQESYKH